MLIGFVGTLIFAEKSFLNEHALGQTPGDAAQLGPQMSPEAIQSPRSAMEELGKAIFFDKSLSNPPGLSCASCHDPESGFAGSSNSQINSSFGIGLGAVEGRCENRNPPTVSYVKFCPKGPPVFSNGLQSYVGGLFRDGHTTDLKSQVRFPFLNPNEMNNIVNGAPAPQLVVEKISKGTYAQLFKQVFGPDVFNKPTDQVFDLIADAIVAFESSTELSPFSSKFDAFLAGKAKLTPSEMDGLELVTGFQNGRPGGTLHKSAQCAVCHGIELDITKGRSLWTQYCFTNIGVPKNLNNPYYFETNKDSNPLGYNRLGLAYVDFGLGDYLYSSRGLPPGNLGPGSNGQGDFLSVNGTFKVPTLRNVDKRPKANFVKAYMHNGFFKSLKDVVHFYNTRNLTSRSGEAIDFTQANPYEHLQGKPLWPAPEYSSPTTMINPSGQPGQVGNLGLTTEEEADIVAFLKTLSDGYIHK